MPLKFLHEIITEKVLDESQASHPAIELENGTTLTYQQLNDKTNQFANYFLKLGIKPGDRIAVMLFPSEMIAIVLLALSKLGATYVPIDPQDKSPIERIKSILQDSSPARVISTGQILHQRNICLSDAILIDDVFVRKEIDKQSEAEPQLSMPFPPDPDLVIIYTSGTTGTPKGVRVGHSGFVEYWQEVLKEKLPGKRKVAGIISPAFDASLWEYLMAWSIGGVYCLASQEVRDDLNKVITFLKEHHITDVTLIPSQIRAIPNLEETLLQLKDAGLVAIYSTGEACSQDIVSAVQKARIALFNCYGPTEASIGISMYELTAEAMQKGEVPIGLPHTSKVKVHLLDENLQPVQEGEEGTLYIESPYLFKGYLNRPGETTASFVQLPTGEKTYNTRDRFIRSADNQHLYFKGRANDSRSLKINGIFINLNEVEQVVKTYLDAQNVAVVTVNGTSGKTQLVAFVVKENFEFLDENKIFSNLKQQLPNIFIPNFYKLKDSLPLTTSGKLDYVQLKQEAHTLVQTSFSRQPDNLSQTPLQEELSNIWKEILGISSPYGLDVKKSFKIYGGDSLTIITLFNEINQRFNINASIEDFERYGFKANESQDKLTNIENLAEYIHEKRWEKRPAQPLHLLNKSDSGKHPVFLIAPITGEGAITYQDFAKELWTKIDTDIYALSCRGLFDKYDIHHSIEELAKDFANAIEHAQPTGEIILLGWSYGGVLANKVTEMLETKQRKVSFVGMIDSLAPNIYQTMQPEAFFRELMKIADYLRKIIERRLGNLSTLISPDNFKNLSHRQQIDHVFDSLLDRVKEDKPLYNLVYTTKMNLLSIVSYHSSSIKKTPYLYSTTTSEAQYGQRMGWKKVRFADSALEGDHFSILETQNLPRLIDIIAPKINQKLLDSNSGSDNEDKTGTSPPQSLLPRYNIPTQNSQSSKEPTTIIEPLKILEEMYGMLVQLVGTSPEHPAPNQFMKRRKSSRVLGTSPEHPALNQPIQPIKRSRTSCS